jgi:hypothetical protein
MRALFNWHFLVENKWNVAILVIDNKRIDFEYFVKLDNTIGYKKVFNLSYIVNNLYN